MPRREVLHTPGLPSAHLAFTDASDGDLRVPEPGLSESPEVAARRHRIAPHPWTWLRQVHGRRVVEADAPGLWQGTEADAAVSATLGTVLSVHTADCAGVVFVGDGEDPATEEPIRVVGAAHAGWRGLQDGVIEATVDAMRRLGANSFTWDLGPCISPAAYEFGEAELDRLCDQLGDDLRATTLDGAPALDVRAGVRAALRRAGVDAGAGTGPDVVPCTALDEGFFSWRARQDAGRQAAVVWLAPDDHDYPWHP
ncbi:polyphenol oxidase family protein [Dermatobacter hominis]|uniref:polyphenol oxidase family protein n=1 Tax=Dermatobacter hominis TaxID=2884263 RepID=UPI001D101090|nr:polyphenol oxidase family protein [Dermatobacter hominis]UDY35981.1 polyphenol oxidase family protein [Dermatobacter hominis]